MSKTTRRRKGDIGEEIALRYLINKGFSLLTRNYLKPWGELDIVMKHQNRIHFIEVKTVSREPSGEKHDGVGDIKDRMRPEENMHRRKLLRLHRAVQTYLLDHKIPVSMEWQIDLACVYLDFSVRRARVEMFESIVV
jgi:putative endonuclease